MDSDLQGSLLSKSKFLNWIKTALALLVTKEEIAPVAYNEIAQFQQKCLDDISTLNSLPPGSTCSKCHTENVVCCRTNKICFGKSGHCKYHSTPERQYLSSGCPNKICHNLNSEIQKAHRYSGPSYKNTDATQWCTDAWEIAKCFMPPDGYKNVKTTADTDFNGVISVFINYKGFDVKIDDDLSKSGNIFYKGREVGKVVRHCPNLEISDTDLTKHFTALQNILNDPGLKAINKSPHNGGQKLAQLQNDEFIIEEDVMLKLLEDEGNTDQRKQLIDIINTNLKSIKRQGNISIAELNEKLNSSIDALDTKTQASVQQIKDVTELGMENLERGVQKIVEEKESALKEIKQATEYGGHSISVSEKPYTQLKQGFKEKLSKFYQRKRSTVPLSPLVEEMETHLAGFYVMPDMVSVEQKSLTSEQQERTPVKSLIDMFDTENKDQQEIYLLADAGFGKTAFSKYLAITWAQTCTPDDNYSKFKNEELKAMACFEFIFLVLLRDSTTVCNIDDMIEQQIVKKLPPSDTLYPLQEVLQNEKCLIILDGLDEWTHPDNGCSEQKEQIPHRYAYDNCVVLTTTRPWKVGVANLKTSDINKKIELVQLSQYSMIQLEKNAIRKMSDVHEDHLLEDKTREFNDIVAYNGLKQMQTVPLLLMYILCLWCNKIPIGCSKIDIYVNIIEFLLSRTVLKHPDINPTFESSNFDLPEYLKKRNLCRKFSSLLTALAELAYHTLFSKKREDTLVFDGSVAEKYLKQNDMTLTFMSGILTESTTKTLVKRTSKVSFSHKTVQEFFAAIFVSSQRDATGIILERCNTIQDILDVSIVCEFVSKLNPKIVWALSSELMAIIDKDEITRSYRKMTWSELISENPLCKVQEMFLSCLKVMPEDENIKLCLQDFFIDEATINDVHLQRLSKINTTNMKSLNINTEDTSSKFNEIAMSFSLKNLNNLQKFYYNGDKENVEIDFCPGLQTLTLSSASESNYEGNLTEDLGNLQGLKNLNIRGIRLSHEMLETFLISISYRKTMKELTLWEMSCREHGNNCKGLSFELSQNSQIVDLVLRQLPPLQVNLKTPLLGRVMLYRINLGEMPVLLSRDMRHLERVEFEYIEFSSAAFFDIIDVLEHLSQSVTVEMRRCNFKPQTESGRVKDYIRSAKTFVILHDRSWRFEFKTVDQVKK